jgi:hypothetical protein
MLWAWLGWLGLLVLVTGVIGSATVLENDPEGILASVGLASFAGLGIWILGVSVGLIQQRVAAVPRTTAT